MKYVSLAGAIILLTFLVAANPPADKSGEKESGACPPPPPPGQAPVYKEGKPVNPGNLSGRVSFVGTYKPMRWKVVKDTQFCGDSVIDESIVVSPQKGLRYVVVSVDDIKEGKPLPRVVKEVANKECRYQPHVESLSVCDKLMITNHDPIFHNTHAYIGDRVFDPQKPTLTKDGMWMIAYEETPSASSAPMVSVTTLFNWGLPTQDFKPKKLMRQPGIITLKCDAGHTWMTGIVWVKPHPYLTVTDADGRYTLTDIPAGPHTVTFWHERLGVKQEKVTIVQGKTVSLDVSFAMK